MKEKGVYCIVDGGYHRWATAMSASRLIVEENFVLSRKRMESVRKDIEDIFEVLKGRFRVLKLPSDEYGIYLCGALQYATRLG